LPVFVAVKKTFTPFKLFAPPANVGLCLQRYERIYSPILFRSRVNYPTYSLHITVRSRRWIIQEYDKLTFFEPASLYIRFECIFRNDLFARFIGIRVMENCQRFYSCDH